MEKKLIQQTDQLRELELHYKGIMYTSVSDLDRIRSELLEADSPYKDICIIDYVISVMVAHGKMYEGISRSEKFREFCEAIGENEKTPI